MGITTREQIIHALRSCRLTVTEISTALKLTRQTVTEYLAKMKDAKQVRVAGSRRTPGGKLAPVYELIMVDGLPPSTSAAALTMSPEVPQTIKLEDPCGP